MRNLGVKIIFALVLAGWIYAPFVYPMRGGLEITLYIVLLLVLLFGHFMLWFYKPYTLYVDGVVVKRYYTRPDMDEVQKHVDKGDYHTVALTSGDGTIIISMRKI